MKRPSQFIGSLLCILSLNVYAEDSMTINIKRLTLETALTIAQATINACRAEGVQIAVTVVDRGGNPQVVLRDVLAPDLTLAISQRKAYAAMAFNAPLGELVDRFRDNPFGPGKVDGVVISAGGIPVQAGGVLLGGIGVSGAPSGETDERCAQAGLDAVQVDLEMDSGEF